MASGAWSWLWSCCCGGITPPPPPCTPCWTGNVASIPVRFPDFAAADYSYMIQVCNWNSIRDDLFDMQLIPDLGPPLDLGLLPQLTADSCNGKVFVSESSARIITFLRDPVMQNYLACAGDQQALTFPGMPCCLGISPANYQVLPLATFIRGNFNIIFLNRGISGEGSYFIVYIARIGNVTRAFNAYQNRLNPYLPENRLCYHGWYGTVFADSGDNAQINFRDRLGGNPQFPSNTAPLN